MARLEEKFAARAQGKPSAAPFPALPQRDTLTELPLEQVRPDPGQPRKNLGDLTDLRRSILSVGIVQPIVVRVAGFEEYQIIAGERRYTAAKEAGLSRIPAIVRTVEAHRQLELQIVENLHRKDLNPLEEAASYRRLMDEFGLTQEELGARLGRSQVSVSETLKLLHLPGRVQEEYRTSDAVSKSLLLEIAKQPTEEAKLVLWEQARRGELTVKSARAHKHAGRANGRPAPSSHPPKSQAFRYPIQTRRALVTVTFEGPEVSPAAILEALEEALNSEREKARMEPGA